MEGRRTWKGYAWAAGATLACTAAGAAMSSRYNLVNVAMVYLLAVVFVALRHGRGPAVACSVLCVAAFDFFFVPPFGALTVDDAQYVVTFAIMLCVGLVISGLAEQARRHAREQAALEIEAETERIRSALLASISHDLRTPLAVMAGASSSLAESGERMSAEERGELARSVFRQSREMSEHVAKILQMTRLEAGAIEVERDWADLGEIASSVLDRLRERLAAHRVVAEIPPDLPLVRVDAALIEQALGNLLENAAKHTPPATVVRLLARRGEREVTLSVEDFGGGLPPQDTERVFAKFQHGSVEASRSGVGLGLAICRAIVRLHGGRAWAEALPVGGTAFRFTLPLEEVPKVAAEAAGA